MVIAFLSIIFGGFVGLTKLGFNTTLSSIISVIAAVFSSYLILGISGMISEFSIKGGSFDISAKFTDEINNVKLDAMETRREFSEKIAEVKLSVKNQNINDHSRTYYYGQAEGQANEVYGDVNIGSQRYDPQKLNLSKNIEKSKELDSLINKMETIEEVSGKQIVPKTDELIRRANFFIGKKSYEKALKYSDDVLKTEPNNSTALFNKAYSLEELNQHENAIEIYKKVLSINPDDVATFHNIGVSFSNMKKYSDAIEMYDKALDLDPKYLLSLNSKANALGYLGKYEDAIELYDKAIEIDPSYANSVYNKSCALAKLGKTNESLIHLEKAIEMDSQYKYDAKDDSDFSSLKNNLEFQKLILFYMCQNY